MADAATPEPLLTPVEEQLNLIAAERDRIAGELHDDSVQAITAVSLQLQRLKAKLDDPEHIALIEQARQTADDAIERLRHMLFVLHPSSLEDDGLVMTLEIYMETYLEPTGIHWSVRGDPTSEFPVGVAALGFRLAREAVSNALRHASPSAINITADKAGDQLAIEVRDDGCGFETGTQRLKSGHLGLKHSQALAQAARGTYQVDSTIEQGTTVRITLPGPRHPHFLTQDEAGSGQRQ